MKKKLLSLVLAGAMVASTSVSAFADTNITGSENAEHEAQVQIRGDIADDNGEIQPGTLNVTVPTAANFKVNDKGQLLGTKITIKNDGSQKVDVLAHAFTDLTNDTNITVKGANEITSSSQRYEIALNIQGNAGTAYLGSNSGTYKNGIFEDSNLGTPSQHGIKLATVNPNNSADLNLSGTAGEQDLDNPVQDNFTLVLKIKKSE